MVTSKALAKGLSSGEQPLLVRFFKAVAKYKYLYLLIAPGIICYILFSYAPMYGIILAFKKFKFNLGITDSPWVGLGNFSTIFRYSEFWNAFKNTIIISLGKLILTFPAPLILALLLNELRNLRYKKVVQSILYMPHFLSWVLVYGIFYSLFSATSGAVTRTLADIGFTMEPLLGNPATFRPVLYITEIWKTAGWGTIMYLAAISGINPELYESSIIDGANRLKQCIYITLPSLKFAIVILLVLSAGGIMQAGFDQVFIFYSPQVYDVGDIIDTYVYRVGIASSRFEIGTAVGLFQSLINCILLIGSDRIAKALGEEGLF